MGQFEKLLDNATDKNIKATAKAAQSGKVVQKVADRKSQIAQVSTGKKK